MEDYWLRCGHRTRADEVFIAGKREELRRRPRHIRWPLRLFWDWLTGYGRKARRIFMVGFGLVILGAIFFNPIGLSNSHRLAQTSFYAEAVGNKAPAATGHPPQEAATGGGDPLAASIFATLGQKSSYENLCIRLMVSVDRLLPTWVDLGFAKDYKPQMENATWGWFHFLYWNLHRLCGWVLVVMGLAALTLRFK